MKRWIIISWLYSFLRVSLSWFWLSDVQWTPPPEHDVTVCRQSNVWREKKPHEHSVQSQRGAKTSQHHHPAPSFQLISVHEKHSRSFCCSGFMMFPLSCLLSSLPPSLVLDETQPATVNICRNMSRPVWAVKACPQFRLCRNLACNTHTHTSVHTALETRSQIRCQLYGLILTGLVNIHHTACILTSFKLSSRLMNFCPHAVFTFLPARCWVSSLFWIISLLFGSDPRRFLCPDTSETLYLKIWFPPWPPAPPRATLSFYDLNSFYCCKQNTKHTTHHHPTCRRPRLSTQGTSSHKIYDKTITRIMKAEREATNCKLNKYII